MDVIMCQGIGCDLPADWVHLVPKWDDLYVCDLHLGASDFRCGGPVKGWTRITDSPVQS